MDTTSVFGSLEQIQDNLKFLKGTVYYPKRKVVCIISDIFQKRHQDMPSSSDELGKNML